ncbi:DUF1634 domain-containing protein [Paludibaculum fermentans]|uniref:DUF1634 domain-containing protein n=1 Tax=Paludibaculum fermentans TaxID=1473598 RepID=A0A7S7NM27_PALFE|nr:DUF1634 domain-containing protein [Paludibaculum fermentans]QOY86141.1 DUF1634 domain-containing protein [Paludibaculum fermentans]
MAPSDHKLQQIISTTLRGGVIVAAAVGLTGGALYLFSQPPVPTFAVFGGSGTPYASPTQVMRLAFAAHGEGLQARGLAIAQLGILCLLLTPILRVAFSIVGFALERDWAYVMITAAVLLALTGSILLR